MADCIPRLDDRDFQTLAMLFPEIGADGFHVVPKTPGACVTVEDVYHEDVWRSRNFFKPDIQRFVTAYGRDNQPLELENGGWKQQRTDLFSVLSGRMLGYPRADLFGAFYGMVKIAGEIINSNDLRRDAVKTFLDKFRNRFADGGDCLEIFKNFNSPDWSKVIIPAMGAIHDWAMGRKDYGTAEFTRVIRAAIALKTFNQPESADSWLGYYNSLDNKQREFYNRVRLEVQAELDKEPPPPPVRPRRARRPKPAPAPRPEAPRPAKPQPPSGGDDEWGVSNPFGGE